MKEYQSGLFIKQPDLSFDRVKGSVLFAKKQQIRALTLEKMTYLTVFVK